MCTRNDPISDVNVGHQISTAGVMQCDVSTCVQVGRFEGFVFIVSGLG
jgi:hypothetical protein